jgi:hypothetical protein
VDPVALGQLARILQLSITPVALISGVGLLLLSMTNRLGRVIDRSRELGAQEDDEGRSQELRILFRRARLLLAAIALLATSIFLAVLMVAALFAMHLWPARLDAAILGLFAACLLCLVASVATFLGDILLSIRWLRLSLGRFL